MSYKVWQKVFESPSAAQVRRRPAQQAIEHRYRNVSVSRDSSVVARVVSVPRAIGSRPRAKLQSSEAWRSGVAAPAANRLAVGCRGIAHRCLRPAGGWSPQASAEQVAAERASLSDARRRLQVQEGREPHAHKVFIIGN